MLVLSHSGAGTDIFRMSFSGCFSLRPALLSSLHVGCFYVATSFSAYHPTLLLCCMAGTTGIWPLFLVLPALAPALAWHCRNSSWIQSRLSHLLCNFSIAFTTAKQICFQNPLPVAYRCTPIQFLQTAFSLRLASLYCFTLPLKWDPNQVLTLALFSAYTVSHTNPGLLSSSTSYSRPYPILSYFIFRSYYSLCLTDPACSWGPI